MAIEMMILGFTTLLLILSSLLGLVAKMQVYGLNWLLSCSPDSNLPDLPKWAQRCVYAHDNLKASYPVFAVSILLLAFSAGFTPATALASLLFLVARLVHMPACIAGIEWLQALTRLLGFLATFFLLGMALAALVSF